jgi:hypothetical protein
MMFVGDKGSIVSGFLREDPKIVGGWASLYPRPRFRPVVAPARAVEEPTGRTITNDAAANKLLTRNVRKGWEI